jgi:protein-tyrosine phosphatase
MQTEITSSCRRLHNIPGVTNLRDIGGYPAGNSALTRWGTLYRGGTMRGIGDQERRRLAEFGIRTVVDLRRANEIETDPHPDLSSNGTAVSYRNISLLTDEIQQARREYHYLLPDIYQAILDKARSQVGESIATLAEPGALPAIVRCTAGKDRTGIVIALALRTAGVPDHAIIYDYALSQKSMETEEFLAFQRTHVLEPGADWEIYRSTFLISPADFMREALAYIDTEYGSACGYLLKAGVDVSTQNHLRRSLVEPRAAASRRVR